jgi:thiamine biosynthesis lipoprotein
LWRLYADHFARNPEDRDGPDPKAVAAALATVDFRRLDVGPERITLGAEGMAVTLNGIAQGYITDRVAGLLRRAGVRDVLIQLGETRALGHRPDGRPWRIGIADPRAPERIARRLPLANRAVATSGGYGARFDRLGRHHHLFDPATGRSAGHYLAVSVIAADATMGARSRSAAERAGAPSHTASRGLGPGTSLGAASAPGHD